MSNSAVIHVKSESEYYTAKAAVDNLVIVDFSAEWCGPCKMIAPEFEKFAQENGDIVCIHVDVDKLEHLQDGQDVRGVPTFKFFRNGEFLEEFSGANIQKLKATAKKYAV